MAERRYVLSQKNTILDVQLGFNTPLNPKVPEHLPFFFHYAILLHHRVMAYYYKIKDNVFENGVDSGAFDC